MHEEVSEKTIALSIQTARLTTSVLKMALRAFLEHQASRGKPIPKGKQTIKQLMNQNTGLSNIEITDQNIKSFERVARKYGIDYALKKDDSVQPPRYLVFFKGRHVDVLTMAFKEYSAKAVDRHQKPSIIKQLKEAMDLLKQHRQREKTRSKDRGVDL